MFPTPIDLQYVPIDCNFFISEKGAFFLFQFVVIKCLCTQFLATVNRKHYGLGVRLGWALRLGVEVRLGVRLGIRLGVRLGVSIQ